MSRVEEKFEKLGRETSEKASEIHCSKEDYIEGLKGIIETLQTDISAAEEF
jgi:hypothetical protein